MSLTKPSKSRSSVNVFAPLLALAVSLSACSWESTHAAPEVSSATLVEIVRGYGQNAGGASASASKKPAEELTSASKDSLVDETLYSMEIKSYLDQQDFEKLDKAALEARTGKGRVLGGIWKLSMFYESVSAPHVGGKPSDEDWKNHLALLRKWAAARPESVTPRVAIAETYTNFAWAARGEGFASTVSNSSWNLFGNRIALASAALVEAAHLKEKCPYWYETMQHVALAQGWDKAQARTLLDQAAAFEPGFYHFYREYAYFLLPKWYGEEGETESFAEEISDRVG